MHLCLNPFSIVPLQHPLGDPEVSSNRLAFRWRLSSADMFRRNRRPRQSCLVDISVRLARIFQGSASSVMPQCCDSSQRPTCSPEALLVTDVHLIVWPPCSSTTICSFERLATHNPCGILPSWLGCSSSCGPCASDHLRQHSVAYFNYLFATMLALEPLMPHKAAINNHRSELDCPLHDLETGRDFDANSLFEANLQRPHFSHYLLHCTFSGHLDQPPHAREQQGGRPWAWAPDPVDFVRCLADYGLASAGSRSDQAPDHLHEAQALLEMPHGQSARTLVQKQLQVRNGCPALSWEGS